MTQFRIASIVEGDGEVEAVPILLRRFAELSGYPGQVDALRPIRQPASKLLKKNKQGRRIELERIVELAIRELRGPGGIFVLLDCEDDCPATLGPDLLKCVRNVRPGFPATVVLAYREYESWFLGAAASLAGRRDLPANLLPHPAPEIPRDCKGWLSAHMPRGRRYDEITDQPALTHAFDFDAARRTCSSFDKCYRALATLMRDVAAIPASAQEKLHKPGKAQSPRNLPKGQ